MKTQNCTFGPFDLARALAGDPVGTADGKRKVIAIVKSPKSVRSDVGLAVWFDDNTAAFYQEDGGSEALDADSPFNLVMLPRVKKIDWSKVAVDTPVLCRDRGYEDLTKRYYSGNPGSIYGDGATSRTLGYETSFVEIQLDFDAPLQYWPGGETAPLPEGVIVEVVFRDGTKFSGTVGQDLDWRHGLIGKSSDIIAYRAVGLAQGWGF